MAAACVITKVGENLTTPVRSTNPSHTKNSREFLEDLRLSVIWKQSSYLWHIICGAEQSDFTAWGSRQIG